MNQQQTCIRKILLAPGVGKEVYLSYDNDVLVIHPYKTIRNMTMHNTLYLINKIPDFLKENSLHISKTVTTNFDIVLAVGYDPIVLQKALIKSIGYDLIFKY